MAYNFFGTGEVVCARDIELPGKWYSPVVCLRVSGHSGECEAVMCKAAVADGVCHWCRVSLDAPHDPDCKARG